MWLCIVPRAGPQEMTPEPHTGICLGPCGLVGGSLPGWGWLRGGQIQPVVSSRMQCPGRGSHGHLLGVRGYSRCGRVSSLEPGFPGHRF